MTSKLTLDQVNSNKFIKLWFLLKLFIISIALTSLVYYFSYNEFFEYNSDYKSLYNLSYVFLDVSLKFLIFGSISLFIFCILFQNCITTISKITHSIIIYIVYSKSFHFFINTYYIR